MPDPDLVSAAHWRPRSRIKPLTSLRLYPAQYTVWAQVRFTEAEYDQNAEVLEQNEVSDYFNISFSDAGHRRDIPLMVHRVRPMKDETFISYYIDLKTALTGNEREGLEALAHSVAEVQDIRIKTDWNTTKLMLGVYVEHNDV